MKRLAIIPFFILVLSVVTNYGPAVAATRHRQEPALTVPAVKYRHTTLANGLNVYSVVDHKSPTVTIQVWYRVGGKNDPEGKSGFAHLFEHIMFKSTKNMKAEMMDRLTEDVGGTNNAYTAQDRTVYFETIPANYLETLLWAEAERMANLTVDERNFASERAVVEEEYRQSVLAPPYGRLDEYAEAHSFTVHPYKNGVIGSIANLDQATVEDVRRFHSIFYRPDNADLIVAGDFDPAQLDAWVGKYFGRIAKPEGEIPRVTVQEPKRTGEKRYDETGPNVPLPAVVIDFLTPPASDADAPALQVAQALLSSGNSSRLYQSLIYRQHLATSAYARADLRLDSGLFTFQTTAAAGKTLDEVEQATLAEIERLKTEPVAPAELKKALNLLLAQQLRSRETSQGSASAVGNAVVMLGNVDRVNTDIARLQSVTPAEIQRVAARYFTPANRVVVRYTAGEQEQGGVSKAAAVTPLQGTDLADSTPVEAPPAASTPRKITFPRPTQRTLPNGLRVVVIPRPGSGLISVVTRIKSGAAADPTNDAGLANFTATLLTRGAGARSATHIAEAIEGLGGFLSSTAGWDSTTVNLSVMASQLDDALPIYADVIRRPTFSPEEVQRLRTEQLNRLTVSLSAPGPLANSVAARVVYGESAYGHSGTGTPETLRAIRPEDPASFYRAHYVPKNTVVVFGGDISPNRAFALATRWFGDWSGGDPPADTVSIAPVAGGRVVVVDKPDAGQAAVMLVQPAIRRSDPNYEVARVANAVVGEFYSSWMNREIRIKRGLSYGVRSQIDARRDGGLFIASAQTRNDAVPKVATLLRQQMTQLVEEPVPASELAPRRASLSGNYARSLETGDGLTAAIAALSEYDLPLSQLGGYLQRVQGVRAEQIKAFASQYLDPAQSSLVIVGDGRKFLPALRRKFANVEVIPISQLDLNKANLTH